MASIVAPDAYKYRLAFGCWINDMRNSALPLQQWPAPHCDDHTVEGVLRTFDALGRAAEEGRGGAYVSALLGCRCEAYFVPPRWQLLIDE